MEKQSTCELEVDAVAADILNRIEIQSKLWSYLLDQSVVDNKYCMPYNDLLLN